MDEKKSINTDSPGDERKRSETENKGMKVTKRRASRQKIKEMKRIWRMRQIW
jgi:hypothetical protein